LSERQKSLGTTELIKHLQNPFNMRGYLVEKNSKWIYWFHWSPKIILLSTVKTALCEDKGQFQQSSTSSFWRSQIPKVPKKSDNLTVFFGAFEICVSKSCLYNVDKIVSGCKVSKLWNPYRISRPAYKPTPTVGRTIKVEIIAWQNL